MSVAPPFPRFLLPAITLIAVLVHGTARGQSSSTSAGPPAPAMGAIEGVLETHPGPPASANVAAVHERDGVSEADTRPAATARTEPDGRFRLDGIPPGRYSVTAVVPGRYGAIATGIVVAADSVSRGVLLRALSEGITLAGTVRSTAGAAIPDAEVRAIRYSDLLGDVFHARADREGRFSVGLPAADYMLLAVAPGFEPTTVPRQKGEARDLALELSPEFPPGPAPDSVIDWLRGASVPLRTAEPGHGTSDLLPLREWIGAARVVSLGEATHGTREFFQLKHRMLEFLVTEMGFDVFAIEATMPECFDVNEYVLTGRGDPERALGGLYFWTWDTQEVLDMIRWMRRYNADPAHRRKVKFYGFDMQNAPRAAKRVRSYLQRVGDGSASVEALAILADPFRAQNLRRYPDARRKQIADQVAECARALDARRSDYERTTGAEEWALARQCVRILSQNVENAGGDWTVRDRSMAQNVEWILDHEGPGSKAVLWAHNAHVSVSGEAAGMGAHLRRALGDRMVVFGFSFNQGSFQAITARGNAGGLKTFTVAPLPPGSLDETLARTGHRVAAFDLRSKRDPAVEQWLAARHLTRSIGAGFNDSLPMMGPRPIVTRHYDALLFVERTTAARPNRSGVRPPAALAAGNRNFEDGAPGRPPPQWRCMIGGTALAYAVEITKDRPHGGSRCAVIRSLMGPYGEWAGTLSQQAPAGSLAGTDSVRLRAWVRLAGGPECRGYVWLRGTKPGFGPASEPVYLWNDEAPITATEWREVELTGKVPPETQAIEYGFALVGDGTLWIDDVKLDPSSGQEVPNAAVPR